MMDIFPTPPDSRPISDRLYQLFNDYRYIWTLKVREADGSFKDIKNRITIPSGLRYDGASVPRFFWTITGIKPDGLQRAAGWTYWKDGSDKVKEMIVGFSGWILALIFFLLWILS